MDITYDEWESLDDGKAIALAHRIWDLRTCLDNIRQTRTNIMHSEEAGQPGRDEAIEAFYDKENKIDTEIDCLVIQFKQRYGFNLDDLDVSDDS